MAKQLEIPLEQLIDIVQLGGSFQTGVELRDSNGFPVISKHAKIDDVSFLQRLKRSGLSLLPFDLRMGGGVWDHRGNLVEVRTTGPLRGNEFLTGGRLAKSKTVFDQELDRLSQKRKAAGEMYARAAVSLQTAVDDVRKDGNAFSVETLQATAQEILQFTTSGGHDIFLLLPGMEKAENYVIDHAIRVCVLGSAIISRFNENFNQMVNNSLFPVEQKDNSSPDQPPFILFQENEIQEISFGFLTHDFGELLLPRKLLDKRTALNDREYETIKTHSSVLGPIFLSRNNLRSPILHNILSLHHSPLYAEEERAYPELNHTSEIPVYAKVCKLVEMFCAMTAKRIYNEASNPISVVTDIVRRYNRQDPYLQLILAAFVKVVGVYPPGSVVFLRNNRLAYVLDSEGPLVIPITDSQGKTMETRPEIINLSEVAAVDPSLAIDRNKILLSPEEYWQILPEFLKSVNRFGD